MASRPSLTKKKELVQPYGENPPPQPLPQPIGEKAVRPALVAPPVQLGNVIPQPQPVESARPPLINRQPMPLETSGQPIATTPERPRLFNPETDVREAKEVPVQDHNGRLKSFLQMFLQGVGPSMQQAQANAGRRGFGAGDFFAGLAGGAGAGVAGAIDPSLDEKIGARQDRLKNEQFQAQEMDKERTQTQIDETRAQAEERKARPGLLQAQADAKAAEGERRNLMELLRLKKSYKKGQDPTFDDRLAKAGMEVPEFNNSTAPKPRHIKVGNEYLILNDDGTTRPALSPTGQPLKEPTVRRNDMDVTPGQALSYDGQLQQRGITAANQQYEDTAGEFNNRRAAAEKAREEMEAAKTKATELLTADKEDPEGIAMLKSAKEKAVRLQREFGDFFDAGPEGEGGWPYATPKNAQRPKRPLLTPSGKTDPLGIRN